MAVEVGGSRGGPGKSEQERFFEAATARAQPAARAEAEAIMRAEAARRARAGEKAPSFMGYELGMIQSDIDKKATAEQPPRPSSRIPSESQEAVTKSSKEFIASGNSYRARVGRDTLQYLDAEKKYLVRIVELTGDGKNIGQIKVIGDALDHEVADWMRYAVAMVEQKTGKKPDALKEGGGGNYAKWNAKTYEVEITKGMSARGRTTVEIKVTTKSDYDSRTVKPAI